MTLKNIRYRLEFFPILVVDGIFHLLPRSWAIKFGEGLGWLMSMVLIPRRRLVLRNLTLAFPEKSEAEKQLIARGMWKNLGRVAAEFMRLSDITAQNFDQFIEVTDGHLFENALAEGKGLIFIGFHFTNWEVTGVAATHLTKEMTSIARPIKNPLVEDWIKKKRGRGNMKIILHRQAVKGSFKVIKEKQTVGILVDQNLYTGGIFVDFFGTPAATTTLPALLHARSGAPLLIGYCLREGNRLRFITEKPKFDFPIDSSEESIRCITQALSHHLERLIRAHPENWFWIHNRWKRKLPPDEPLPH